MILRVISSFLFGLLLILPLDFLFFIGLKIHYFDLNKIDVFFNIYFFDNQPFLWILLTSFVLGFLIFYTAFRRIFQVIYIIVLLLFFCMLFEPVAEEIGRELFSQNNLTCKLGKQEFKANLLYNGRKNYYIKRDGISKTIKIPKNELKIKNLVFD